MFEINLEDGEAKGTTRDADNVEVEGTDKKGRIIRLDGRRVDEIKADVRKLTVVSGTTGIAAHGVKSIRVHVHTDRRRAAVARRDLVGVVERLYKLEVVRVEFESLRVIVLEGDRVKRITTVEDVATVDIGIRNRVVRVITAAGVSVVLHGPHKHLDRVVKGELGTSILGQGNVRLGGVVALLVLFDNNITGAGTHLTAFVIRHNSVVAPALASGLFEIATHNSACVVFRYSTALHTGSTPPANKFFLLPEFKLKFNIIIRKGSRGESYTTIPRVEKGNRDVKGVLVLRNRRGYEGGHITDHLVVAVLFTSGVHEGSPPVEVETRERLDFEVVK